MAAATTVAAVTSMLTGPITMLHEGRLSAHRILEVLLAPGIAGLLLIAAAILGVAGRREWSASALAAAAPWLFLTPLYFGVSSA